MKKLNSKFLIMPILFAVLFLCNIIEARAMDTCCIGSIDEESKIYTCHYHAEVDMCPYSSLRTLYLPNELMHTEKEYEIFSYSFYIVKGGGSMTNFAIYMRNYDGKLSANDPIDTSSANGFVRVYSVGVFKSKIGWNTIEFDKPFIFDSRKPLEIVIVQYQKYPQNHEYTIVNWDLASYKMPGGSTTDYRYFYSECGYDGTDNNTYTHYDYRVPVARFVYRVAESITLNRQPADIEVCPDEKEVKLNVEAVSNKDNNNLKYQWYYDGKKLLDGSVYKGVNTPELSVTLKKSRSFPEAFYCRIWLKDNDPIEKYEQTNDTYIAVLEDYQPTITSTHLNGKEIEIDNKTIELTEGEKLNITLETANPATDVITWAKFNPKTKEYEFLDKVGKNFNIPVLQLSDSGKYAIYIKNECKQYLVAEFTLNIKDPTSITDLSLSGIEVVPNPVSGKLRIKYHSNITSEATINIMDITGTIVYSINRLNTIGLNEIFLDVNELNMINGTYFIRINSKDIHLLKSFTVYK